MSSLSWPDLPEEGSGPMANINLYLTQIITGVILTGYDLHRSE